VIEKSGRGNVVVAMRPSGVAAVEAAIERLGEMPLPPYIKEELDDPERYQTVYAREVGSAAAPTAGLHFDHPTLRALREMGVSQAFVRLDVGLDTFRPIARDEVEEHRIHAEEISVDEEACETINAARSAGKRIVAVGTTVVRALESAASGGRVKPRRGRTDLFIYPGYRFEAVDCLLTNFHMPRSSLLLLVCAFAGRELVLEAYRRAVEEGYRFLSLGDACYFHYSRGWIDPGDTAESRREGQRRDG
jgi:S-adenosylmethionine:tRNA ribosyltransferase-isomerase